MRLWSFVRIVLMAVPLLLGSGLPLYAQYYGYPANSPYPQQRRDPRAYPPGYYPGKLVQPAQPGFSLRRLFGVQEPPPLVQPQIVRPRRAPPRAPIVRPPGKTQGRPHHPGHRLRRCLGGIRRAGDRRSLRRFGGCCSCSARRRRTAV